ncbi:MAG TPA: MOSC domain-containing protein [Dehalococcoidia bacterium]|nr:MOSC domain-containing protein [Dehalococcoidia bacterium]
MTAAQAVVGHVAALYTAGSAGAPMQRHRQIELITGVGVAGDRYALGTGYWSDPRWPDQELTLLMAETATALGLDPASLRRNIVTRGVDLDALIGVTFQIGEATLLGVRRCDPCRYIERFTRSGAMRELATRGGLRAHIVTGGRVHVGDRPQTLQAHQAVERVVSPSPIS